MVFSDADTLRIHLSHRMEVELLSLRHPGVDIDELRISMSSSFTVTVNGFDYDNSYLMYYLVVNETEYLMLVCFNIDDGEDGTGGSYFVGARLTISPEGVASCAFDDVVGLSRFIDKYDATSLATAYAHMRS